MKPLVSILIPVYNRSDLIEETIKSALQQTYENIEIVVVDNQSTDNTWAILSALASIDDRIKIYQNEVNIGPVKNWKITVDLARGEYSKILWSDDLMHPTFLSSCIDYLNDNSVAFVYSSVKIFENDPNENKLISYQRKLDGKFVSEEYIEEALLGNNIPYSPGCAVFRTSDLKKNFLINIENQINSDFSSHAIGPDLLLFLNIAKRYSNVAHVKAPLSYFRSHKGSISVENTSFKLTAMYNIAKSFFLSSYTPPNSLVKKYNSSLLLFHIKNSAQLSAIGITEVSRFYPSAREITYSYRYILLRVLAAIYKKTKLRYVF